MVDQIKGAGARCGTGAHAPLHGVKVVELTSVLMGPWACQILGDFGADVIKVEPPTGDSTRGIGPSRNPGMSAFFLNLNRNKRSIALDLKTKKGYDAFLSIVKEADVLVYNVRPQAMKRLNLDYETLKELNPRLIHVGAFGFGQDGPYAQKPAYDDLIQGLTALPALSADVSDGVPRYLPVTIVDRTVALHVVNAVLAALLDQRTSGQGQAIEIPMFETMAQYVLGDHLQGHTFLPPSGRMRYDRLLVQERRPYKTKDGYVCVLVYNDRHWKAFCGLMGRPELWNTDPRLIDIRTRTQHIRELYGMVADAMATKTTEEWMRLLEEADIPANPLHTPESLLDDPHLQTVGFFGTSEHPSEGLLKTMQIPGRWSRTPPDVRRLAPRLGEHSLEILRETGMDEVAIRSLLEDGGVVQSANISGNRHDNESSSGASVSRQQHQAKGEEGGTV
ncbi:CaiB/BaiF CoA transferase family protein [Paraburkholderia sp. GAS32]|uniref:CaiB/BaiF CoA transferase family protein n=1 Tax=Paraburkholderia sp. GAS32 TaxID=3035129 RepID=UPI003D1B7C74